MTQNKNWNRSFGGGKSDGRHDYLGPFEIHPAAKMFPEMEYEELVKLSESIKRDGIQHPIAIWDGKLVDGRNRVRAATLAGISEAKIPKIHIPLEIDPYKYAWSANCERLDYSKAAKAELHIRILKESGQWEKLQRETKEKARTARAADVARRRGPDGRVESKPASLPPSGGTPEARKPDPRKNSMAAKIAHAAGVSQRTVERNLAKKKKPPAKLLRKPSRYIPPKWRRLFQRPERLAVEIRIHMTSKAIHSLVTLLLAKSSEPHDGIFDDVLK